MFLQLLQVCERSKKKGKTANKIFSLCVNRDEYKKTAIQRSAREKKSAGELLVLYLSALSFLIFRVLTSKGELKLFLRHSTDHRSQAKSFSLLLQATGRALD